MKNSSEKFTGKADAYSLARPAYPKKFLDDLYEEFGCSTNSVIADIGSGTGKLTRMLLEKGNKVFAIEPNADMREKAESQLNIYKNFYSINACAENTTLSDKSIDFITVAQAFHWFDTQSFKKECSRILKLNGKIMIVYNLRNQEAECTKALAALRKKFNAEFKGFSNGISNNECLAFFNNKCDIFKCVNDAVFDRQGYINRIMSSSYSLKENDLMFSEYLDDINALFDKFSVNGKITIPTHTVAYIG